MASLVMSASTFGCPERVTVNPTIDPSPLAGSFPVDGCAEAGAAVDPAAIDGVVVGPLRREDRD